MSQDDVLRELSTILSTVTGVDPGEVTPQTSFTDDLDIDSMTMVEVIVAAEDRYGLLIPDDEWSRFSTVGRPRGSPGENGCRRAPMIRSSARGA